MCDPPPIAIWEVKEHYLVLFVFYSLYNLPISHVSHNYNNSNSTDMHTTPPQLLTQSLEHPWLRKQTGKTSILVFVFLMEKSSFMDEEEYCLPYFFHYMAH